MSKTGIILICIAVILLLGVVILPLFNRSQFKKMPIEQQVLAIMKQAKGLVYFKNISNGRTGNLCYVKNKRKILIYPWVITQNGNMKITKENPFDNWDYPEEKEPLSANEIRQAHQELEKYSKKSPVRIIWNKPFEQNEAE